MTTPHYMPLICLVGRPNVGKSTLFNRMVGPRSSLVYDTPGVTRDRILGEMVFEGRCFRVMDTGGLVFESNDTWADPIRQQTQAALEEADLVVWLLDGQDGLHTDDPAVARMLRRSGKPWLPVVNKLDVPQHDERMNSFYALGLDTFVGISAEHGRGYQELFDAMMAVLPVQGPTLAEHEAHNAAIVLEDERDTSSAIEQSVTADSSPEGDDKPGPESSIEWTGGPIRVAVLGRPNAGKSSLINKIIGEERLLATPVAGTTRDAVSIEMEHEGQQYVFVDTAGIRRKPTITEKLEYFSIVRAVKALDQADVALIVLDAARGISHQDARIVELVHRRGKAMILVANKWDLVRSSGGQEEFVDQIEIRFPHARYATLRRVSALTGRSVQQLFPAIVAAQQERHRRVHTSALNRFFRHIVEAVPPPNRGRKRPRLYFATQPMVRPPTFVFVASQPEHIKESYRRYIENNLRRQFGFRATPIWLKFRPHHRNR